VTSQEPPQSPSPIDVWQPHQPVPLASARRWPRRLLLLVLLGLSAAGTGIGVEQRMVAAQWRERAETLGAAA
jgi:hypothetical protein